MEIPESHPDPWMRIAGLLMRAGGLLVILGLAQVLPDTLASPPQHPVHSAVPRWVALPPIRPPATRGRLALPTPGITTTPGASPPRALLPDNQTDSSPGTGSTATPPSRQAADAESIPTRLVIPSIDLNAPIVPVGLRVFEQDSTVYGQWMVPDQFAAGWQSTSAVPGRRGNTVLDGHNNVWGAVFGHLADLRPGAFILVYSGPVFHRYTVADRQILLEKGQPMEVRMRNARWIEPMEDERLTLVTCWPNTDNTYRLIVVAKPVAAGSSSP